MKFLFVALVLQLTLSDAMHNSEPAENLPYYAYVTFVNAQMEFYGGGALISGIHVLTCGANVQGFTMWRVSVGSNRRSQHQNFITTQAVAHPNYAEANNVRMNDIGIITLLQPVVFSASIFPIALGPVFGDEEPSPMLNIQSLIMGFAGNLTAGTQGLENLTQGHVRTTDVATCVALYPASDLIQHFCAEDRSVGSNFCLGDQGGPVTTMARGREIMVGIQSLPGCTIRPSLYIRVSSYREWIRSETGV
ncbi:CLUMA_CG003813, isoform A [Clunio marinus]|uniref:CLUMA_CG003813, isoform A n=1 Tax=Clunio marinus TaxID=568069 RepID=A0A1J1HPW6_9DIPT|nr:CLUMA_CG003813, isoform A [Clunio marinus]